MKQIISLLQVMFLSMFVCVAASSVKSAEANNAYSVLNRIEGIVWSPYRQPVSDVYVELQTDNYTTLNRVRTNASGRFSFVVSRQGNYNVRVLASGTNYLDATEPVELVNMTRTASDNVYLDIYLKFDKRKVDSGVSGITEAVFVQEVPEEARKLYKSGVKSLGDNDDKGFDEIERALKIFPDYYEALNTIGREYVQRKEYRKSLPYLIKSIDTNQRSFSSFYALAYACYQLNHRREALEAARAATILQPNSINAQLLYGTVLRIDGSYEKAEKTLLQAKSLNKNNSVAEIHWQLALLYNKLGRNQEAAVELETYLKILPNASNKEDIKNLIAKLRKETK